MKAVVYTGTQACQVQDVPEPVIGAGQALLEVSHCGICGSDMHAWHGHDARRVPPLILGHEMSGVIRGGALDGQRVAVNPLDTCGTCRFCRAGAVHLCPDRRLMGMATPGGFAERVAVTEANVTVLPDTLDFASAALAEPLACSVHAVAAGLDRLPQRTENLRVAILGGGAIGLLSALAFRARGVGDLWIAETNPLRRDGLQSVTGATAYDPRDGGPEAESVDLILDAVGSGRTRAAASALVRPGGLIVHIGLQDSDAGLDTRRLTLQEIGFLGVYCYTPADFAAALGLLADGAVSAGDWVDRRPLDAGPAGFQDIHDGAALPKIILEV